ncbi:hypothetical protein Ancab_020188 [Ancistrocladus abbreviatus]
MKQLRRWQRICILFLLSLSVFAPVIFVSHNLKILTLAGGKEFIEDLSRVKYRTDTSRLNAIQQEAGEGVKEPNQEVYRDQKYSIVSYDSNEDVKIKEFENGSNTTSSSERFEAASDGNAKNEQMRQKEAPDVHKENQSNQITVPHNQGIASPDVTAILHDQDSRSPKRKVEDEKIQQMKDQLVRAKAYLSFAVPARNSHLVKELKQRIKEVEKALGEARKDSELSRSASQKIKNMEATLSKASHAYPDCSAMVKKLRAMTQNTEEQVQAQRDESNFLTQLAGRTTPKGLHCLSMRLTAEYFTTGPEEKELINQQNFHNPDLFHFAVFSDNILACAVVVNSTVSNAMEPEKIVFHVVTDSLNFPGISMWFLINPPGKATIQVLSIENFSWLSTKYASLLEKQKSVDPRYSSPLNHLRFHLPHMFPDLEKIMLLDHDVVVQRDLRGLWNLDMKGKVNAAVETCQEGKHSYSRMNMLINFSDPMVAERFDINGCTWAFGMNLFDLREWRQRDLSRKYYRFLLMGYESPLWKAGTLPLAWITFYNMTLPLDWKWHVLGLGYDSGVRTENVEQAAVIHYDGIKKPWLDIGIGKHKCYWNKYLDFDHPYLQHCNIHGY